MFLTLLPSKLIYRSRLLLIVSFFILVHSWISFAYADVQRIAILELNNRAQQKISKSELNYLTNEIRLVISYLPKDQFLVMTKESMLTLLEPGKTLEDCVGQCEVETGRLLNADWIITGEILRFGSSLRVSLRLHDTQKGQFIKGVSLKGTTIESLETPLHIAALRLMYEIDPQFKKKALKHWGTDLNIHLKHLHNDLKPLTDLVSDPPKSSSTSLNQPLSVQSKPKKTSKSKLISPPLTKASKSPKSSMQKTNPSIIDHSFLDVSFSMINPSFSPRDSSDFAEFDELAYVMEQGLINVGYSFNHTQSRWRMKFNLGAQEYAAWMDPKSSESSPKRVWKPMSINDQNLTLSSFSGTTETSVKLKSDLALRFSFTEEYHYTLYRSPHSWWLNSNEVALYAGGGFDLMIPLVSADSDGIQEGDNGWISVTPNAHLFAKGLVGLRLWCFFFEVSSRLALYGTKYTVDWTQYQYNQPMSNDAKADDINQWFTRLHNSYTADFQEFLELKAGILYTF